jgi:hypothetical protein
MPSTVQWSEVAFTLLTFPGVILWALNVDHAVRSYFDTRGRDVPRSSRMYALSVVLETVGDIVIGLGIMGLGVFLMFYPPNPAGSSTSRLVVAAVPVGVSVIIAARGAVRLSIIRLLTAEAQRERHE